MGLVPPKPVIRRKIDKAYPDYRPPAWGYTMREVADAFAGSAYLPVLSPEEEELQPVPTYPTWEHFKCLT